jgi:hypothetical protein
MVLMLVDPRGCGKSLSRRAQRSYEKLIDKVVLLEEVGKWELSAIDVSAKLQKSPTAVYSLHECAARGCKAAL